jgi:hypothetical protein
LPGSANQHLLGSVLNISLNSHSVSVKILTALLPAQRASDPICIANSLPGLFCLSLLNTCYLNSKSFFQGVTVSLLFLEFTHYISNLATLFLCCIYIYIYTHTHTHTHTHIFTHTCIPCAQTWSVMSWATPPLSQIQGKSINNLLVT